MLGLKVFHSSLTTVVATLDNLNSTGMESYTFEINLLQKDSKEGVGGMLQRVQREKRREHRGYSYSDHLQPARLREQLLIRCKAQ